MNGIQVSHHIPSRMGETSAVSSTTTSPRLSWACKQPITRRMLWVTGSKRELLATMHELQVETELPEWLQPFTEGVRRGSSSSTDVSPADVAIPPPALSPSTHPPAKPSSKRAREEHNLFTHFPTDPNGEVCRRTKVTRAPCRRIPVDRAHRILTAIKMLAI